MTTQATHKILDLHDFIGWDVDKTLINGKKSFFWRAYVESNPSKQHHIITFRSKKDAEDVYKELSSEFLYPLNEKHFVDLHYMPFDISKDFDSLHPYFIEFNHRKCYPTQKLERILKRENITLEEVISIKDAVYDWKANKCKELGLTVLVDDLEKIVKHGCDLNEVTFVNSLKG